MTDISPDHPAVRAGDVLARRTFLGAGLGLAAFAAAPADACVLVATGEHPRSFFNDGRARLYLESLLRAANSEEPVPYEQRPPEFEIVEGDRVVESALAHEWLVSNGRRDSRPALLAGMTRIGRADRRLVYAVGLQRSQYLLERNASDCDGGHRDEGYYDELQTWLYVFAPNSICTLQRLATLDRSIFALVEGVNYVQRRAAA